MSGSLQQQPISFELTVSGCTDPAASWNRGGVVTWAAQLGDLPPDEPFSFLFSLFFFFFLGPGRDIGAITRNNCDSLSVGFDRSHSRISGNS
jgi:hypothetical protein